MAQVATREITMAYELKKKKHFPVGKEEGKSSKEVGEPLDKVLTNLVYLWREPCSGQQRLGQRHPRVPSSQYSSALHGHVPEYFFLKEVRVILDILS